MADNLTGPLTGSGTATPIIATDELAGSVHVQRVKAGWGPDGTLNDADTASGKALPVQLRDSDGTDVALSAKVGALTETAPASDTASSGLNGRLQRIAQRLSDVITELQSAPVLGAGAAIVGKVGIDQTIVGTTDSVTVATGQGAGATLGTTAGAAVITDATGTIQQYLRGLIKLAITSGSFLVTASLAAGTNSIGKLAANSGVDIGDVDVMSMPTGASSTTTQGSVAHDGVDAQNPVKVGMRAIAHGTNPTAVAAADRTDLYANRAGIPFVIGGHPNIVTTEYMWTTAQTNDAIVTISSGLKIVVTQIQVLLSDAATVAVAMRIGFATATLATAPTDGTAVVGAVASHPGMVPGSIYTRGDGSGILGIGADDEDLRITAGAPTSGEARALISYYTIES